VNLLGTLLHLFLRFGYAAVVFGVMAENAGIPLPGETILLAAGFFASQGHFDIFLVILFAGAVMGDNVGYFLGRKVARPFVHLHRYSFPSGHTLVATAAYGMAAYLLGELQPAFRRTAQWGDETSRTEPGGARTDRTPGAPWTWHRVRFGGAQAVRGDRKGYRHYADAQLAHVNGTYLYGPLKGESSRLWSIRRLFTFIRP